MDHNIENHVVKAVVPLVMDRFRPGWRERAEAQRSWWKMLEIGVTFGLFLSLWILAAPWLSGKIHAQFYPNDMLKMPSPFRASISFWTAFAIFPIALPLLCLAGIILNCAGIFLFHSPSCRKGRRVRPRTNY